MVTKNSLNAIKKRDTSILENADKKKISKKKVSKKITKKVLVKEKEDRPLMIKLTKSEFEVLKNKAGITPISSYLKHFLRTQTNILKSKN